MFRCFSAGWYLPLLIDFADDFPETSMRLDLEEEGIHC